MTETCAEGVACCRRGHPLTGANVLHYHKGERTYLACRECNRLNCKRQRLQYKWKAPKGSAPIPGGCLQCKTRKAQEGRRGLCRCCHEDHGIRAKYAGGRRSRLIGQYKAESGQKSIEVDFFGGQEPPEPTEAKPGSEAKLEAMAKRASAGLSLHCEGDATNEGEIVPLGMQRESVPTEKREPRRYRVHRRER